MTQRQKNLGVTEIGYEYGIERNEFLACYDAFLAKIATVKKGQYTTANLCKKLFNNNEWAELKADEIRPFLNALSANKSNDFNYTNTYGLDTFTIK